MRYRYAATVQSDAACAAGPEQKPYLQRLGYVCMRVVTMYSKKRELPKVLHHGRLRKTCIIGLEISFAGCGSSQYGFEGSRRTPHRDIARGRSALFTGSTPQNSKGTPCYWRVLTCIDFTTPKHWFGTCTQYMCLAQQLMQSGGT